MVRHHSLDSLYRFFSCCPPFCSSSLAGFHLCTFQVQMGRAAWSSSIPAWTQVIVSMMIIWWSYDGSAYLNDHMVIFWWILIFKWSKVLRPVPANRGHERWEPGLPELQTRPAWPGSLHGCHEHSARDHWQLVGRVCHCWPIPPQGWPLEVPTPVLSQLGCASASPTSSLDRFPALDHSLPNLTSPNISRWIENLV